MFVASPIVGVHLWLAVAALAVPPSDRHWDALYDGRFCDAEITVWMSPATRSQRTTEGLHMVVPPTAKQSGRFYSVDWHVRPEAGATVETRLKVAAASGPWGVVLGVSDGVHEEGISFLPHQVVLSIANLARPFDTADGFHTYQVRIRVTDIQVWADGKLLVDGRGKFTAPAHAGRNQLGCGCGRLGRHR